MVVGFGELQAGEVSIGDRSGGFIYLSAGTMEIEMERKREWQWLYCNRVEVILAMESQGFGLLSHGNIII